MDRPLELACYIGSINVRDIRGHMGSYCRQPSFPPTPKMIIPLTSKSLSMRIASGFPSLLTIRPPMLNRRTHQPTLWPLCGPTRDIQSPNFRVATHVQPNCKMRSIRSRGRTLRGTSHVRRLCRRPVRRRCRVRQVEGGVGAGGRSLEWSMGSRVWQRYRKHDHFGPDFHPLI